MDIRPAVLAGIVAVVVPLPAPQADTAAGDGRVQACRVAGAAARVALTTAEAAPMGADGETSVK